MIPNDDLFIDTPQALVSLCARLKDAEWIALDTEFMRERTYFPRLCLVQVATQAMVACIDPLALKSLDPLLEVIYDPRSVKVLHAAYQDLEIFYHLRSQLPQPVFDTQVAAGLLGYGEQVGYAGLVQQVLDVQLPKAHSRSDWCARPLDAAQLRYAADDVRYLSDLYPRLRSLLTDLGRLEWLAEDFGRLCDPSTYRLDIEHAWQRVGGLQSLKPRQLNILRALAAWREHEAAARDLPRKWVLPDPVLLDLARLAPRDRLTLARIRGLHKSQLAQHGQAILGVIGAALREPESTWPQQPPRRLLTPPQEAAVDMLMALVRNQAALHEVSPTAIATRATLERLVLGDTQVPVLHGWRAQLAGHALLKLLSGRLRVSLQPGGLRVEETSSPTG